MIHKLLPRFHTLHTSFADCFRLHEEHPKPHRNPVKQSLADMLTAHPHANIYVDTCSLLTDYGTALLDAAETLFPRYQKKLIILSSVVFELQNLAKKNPSKAALCRTVLQKLHSIQTVSFVQSSSPNFSDAGFISLFVSELEKTDIILISQDRQLSEAAASLPAHLAGCIKKMHSVFVYRLKADGSLVPSCQNKKVKGENHHDEQQYQPVQPSGEFRFSAPAAVFGWSSANNAILPPFRAGHGAECPRFSWADD